MYMCDVPRRRTEVVFFVVLHRDGICTDLFCFLSIPNSIPGSSTSPFLSLLYRYGVHSYLHSSWLETGLPRGFPGTLFSFISFLFRLCYIDKPR